MSLPLTTRSTLPATRWLSMPLAPTTALLLLPALFRLAAPASVAGGAQGGRLAPCPATPNCVASQPSTDDAHRMPPIPFTGSAAEAGARIRRVVEAMPRTRVVRAEGAYLHAEVRTRLLRFVDDVEFLVDPDAGVIHFRSASRVGRSDLGTNRRRMEEVSRRFVAR